MSSQKANIEFFPSLVKGIDVETAAHRLGARSLSSEVKRDFLRATESPISPRTSVSTPFESQDKLSDLYDDNFSRSGLSLDESD